VLTTYNTSGEVMCRACNWSMVWRPEAGKAGEVDVAREPLVSVMASLRGGQGTARSASASCFWEEPRGERGHRAGCGLQASREGSACRLCSERGDKARPRERKSMRGAHAGLGVEVSLEIGPSLSSQR
jgi:hypothetical protein